MKILGLSTMSAGAAAIANDGTIVSAIEEERLTRIKNDGGFPYLSIRSCLHSADMLVDDIDAICVFWKPWRIGSRAKFVALDAVSDWRVAKSRLRHIKKVIGIRDTIAGHPEMRGRWFDLFQIRKLLTKNLGEISAPIKFFDHHDCHMASAYFVSGFDEALSLTYDGGGEEHSTVIKYVSGSGSKTLRSIPWPNSLGHYYSAFTGFLGFKMLEDEYKMMGLAPHGTPTFRNIIGERVLRKTENGGYVLNRRLLNYHAAIEGRFSPEFTELFGAPRSKDDEVTDRHRNLAASVQAVFEDVLIHMMTWAKQQKPGVRQLCVAGGCALNVTANGKLAELDLFERIFVPPAPHDAGCAIGAAFLGERHFGSETASLSMPSAFLGEKFTNEKIEVAFRALCLTVPPKITTEKLVYDAAAALARGEVLAWYQGASEFGPRALGNRSFLADPRDDSIREIINAKIKKRELFRPFAPSVKEEVAERYFELSQLSPFMNIVSRVRPEMHNIIPAVTHVDGTARVHTVSRETNPRFWSLLDQFERLTGIGVLLNTSFNIQEPIVNTPEEALTTFLSSGVDKLCISNFICDASWREANAHRAGTR